MWSYRRCSKSASISWGNRRTRSVDFCISSCRAVTIPRLHCGWPNTCWVCIGSFSDFRGRLKNASGRCRSGPENGWQRYRWLNWTIFPCECSTQRAWKTCFRSNQNFKQIFPKCRWLSIWRKAAFKSTKGNVRSMTGLSRCNSTARSRRSNIAREPT